MTRKESSPSQKEEPAVVIASEAQKEPMETRARRASLEHPAKTEEPVEESTASPKRRSKMKLNFDQVMLLSDIGCSDNFSRDSRPLCSSSVRLSSIPIKSVIPRDRRIGNELAWEGQATELSTCQVTVSGSNCRHNVA